MTSSPRSFAEAVASGSDHALLHRYRGGSQDAATQLYVRYVTRLLHLVDGRIGDDLAPRIDAEDVVQSVFRSFFRGVAQGYYDVPAGEELWGLLLVMALNKVRAHATHHRAAKRDVRSTIGSQVLDESADAGNDEIAASFLKLAIDEVLSGLSELDRKVIELRIAGHDVQDITDAVGRSKRTVERVLQEFRARLARALSDDHEEGSERCR